MSLFLNIYMNSSRYLLPATLAILSLMSCMVFGLGVLAVVGLHYQDAFAIRHQPTPVTNVIELPITPFPITAAGNVDPDAEVLAARREQTYAIELGAVENSIEGGSPLSSYASEEGAIEQQSSLSANNPELPTPTATSTPPPTPISLPPTATPTSSGVNQQPRSNTQQGTTNQSQAAQVQVAPTYAPTPTPKPFIPGQLMIPSIGVNQYVVSTPLRNNEWDLLNLGHRIGWLPTTGVQPNDEFAMVFAAHVTDYDGSHGPFYNLRSVPAGTEFVYRWQGTDYVYQIQEKEIVHPGAVEKLYVNDGSYALLITCTNWNSGAGNYSDRVIAVAKLIRTAPSG